MKKILILFFVFIELNFAQTSSIYSNFGVGELNINPTARRSGMGIAVANNESFDINPFNPASSTNIQLVKFLASFNYSSNSYKDFYSSNKYTSGSFENLFFAIPVQRDYGIVISGGILPFTKLNYKVLSPDIYFDSIPFQVKYEGLGGLTNYFVGVSYRFEKVGSFGISSNFLIGTINKKISTEFLNQNFVNPEFTSQLKYRGVAFRLGYISDNIKNYFPEFPIKDLKVGISYLTSTKLRTELLDLKHGIFIDTTGESSFDTKIPSQFAFGLTSKISERFSFSVDFLNQNWTNLSTNTYSNFDLVNQNVFTIGFEYLPLQRPEKFIDALTYRFGIFIKDIGIQINNEKIREYGIKLGTSIPIDQLNLIDFGFQYSVRGKNSTNLVKESVLNFWFGINLAEIWFVRNEE
ncbi:MAG: hypothetical protein ACPL25_08045 [Ignavibacteria bacterium]